MPSVDDLEDRANSTVRLAAIHHASHLRNQARTLRQLELHRRADALDKEAMKISDAVTYLQRPR